MIVVSGLPTTPFVLQKDQISTGMYAVTETQYTLKRHDYKKARQIEMSNTVYWEKDKHDTLYAPDFFQ